MQTFAYHKELQKGLWHPNLPVFVISTEKIRTKPTAVVCSITVMEITRIKI
jgi:hypothetical protein